MPRSNDKIYLVAKQTKPSIENFWHNVELVKSLNDLHLVSVLLLGYYKFPNHTPEDLEKELRLKNSPYSLHVVVLKNKKESSNLEQSKKGEFIQCRYLNKEKPYPKSYYAEYALEVRKNTTPIKTPSLLKKSGIFVLNNPEKQPIVSELKENKRHLQFTTEEQHTFKESFFKILFSDDENKLTEYESNISNSIYVIVNAQGIIICNIGIHYCVIDGEATDYFVLL